MSRYRELSLHEIKDEELNILIAIKHFCKDHGLRYSLAGGTLLGAIRHKGFIPWDDDIDVTMPRPDYERFIRTFPGPNSPHDSLSLLRLPNKPSSNLYTKVVNTEILVDEQYVGEEEYLWVDVLPVDGLPANSMRARTIYSLASVLRRIFILGRANECEGKTRSRKTIKRALVPFIKYLHLDYFCARQLRCLATRVPFASTDCVGGITWGLYGVGERISVKAFEKMASVQFAGHEFSAISCWDEYLHGLYGDYMKLPPVDQRVNHGLHAKKILN